MLTPTIHQRTHDDYRCEHPAATVPSESYATLAHRVALLFLKSRLWSERQLLVLGAFEKKNREHAGNFKEQ